VGLPGFFKATPTHGFSFGRTTTEKYRRCTQKLLICLPKRVAAGKPGQYMSRKASGRILARHGYLTICKLPVGFNIAVAAPWSGSVQHTTSRPITTTQEARHPTSFGFHPLP
jgi:hypothetical protein